PPSTAPALASLYTLSLHDALPIFSGSLSDHYGRRWFLLGGVLVFAAASWAASRTQTFAELMAARALTGLAAGAISTCSIAYAGGDRKSTRLNSSHVSISYAVFCLK